MALVIALGGIVLQPMLPAADRARAANPPGFLAEEAGATQEPPSAVATADVATGFAESTVFTGLVNPTVVRFASDGRVFVAEKRGVIKVFDSLSDSTPTTFADLRSQVHDFWDRGLLGMALDPNFPATPDVYVLYARDAPIGGTAPVWNDACPTPPGPTTNGCVVSGRLSRLTASGNTAGPEQALITDWCQQYPSHSVGTLQFGPDGMLYLSAGDGASFTFVDYGQAGNPVNPCGDPPGGAGGTQSPPTAEGGALRSQDVRTSADPAGLDGAILRLNKLTGEAATGNPAAGSADPNARRVIAQGMRNPFRFTFRPGSSELWVGDVGWNDVEEINRLTNLTGSVKNLGWPCYEGSGRQPSYDAANLDVCETLYSEGSGAVTAPYFAYRHDQQVVPGEDCPSGSSAIVGLAFYEGGNYPASYDGALFFADNSRDCIWVARAGGNGLPDMAQRATFVGPAANPVDLEIGPGGDLYYVDFDGGTIRRIRYVGNNAPTAVAVATPASGGAPLTVQLSGSTSSDPDGDSLTYAWDLDEDGQFDDATGVSTSRTYGSAGTYNPSLRVNDGNGGTDTDSVTVVVGNAAPTASITSPSGGSASSWSVGQDFAFSGTGSDPEDGMLSRFAMDWTLIMHHCPSNCHTHVVQNWADTTNGTFSTPDHEYPSHLELRLTVTDSGGLSASDSVDLNPRTVQIGMQSQPAGLQLTNGNVTGVTPFSATIIEGGSTSVSAAPLQVIAGVEYRFVSWSDGGAATHDVTGTPGGLSLTARYAGPPTASITSPTAATRDNDGSVTISWTASAAANDAIAGYVLVEEAAAQSAAGTCTGVTWSATGRQWTGPSPRIVKGLEPISCHRYRVVVSTTAGQAGGATSPAIEMDHLITRLRSDDTQGMALSLSRRAYPSGAPVVYLASGTSPAVQAAAAAAAAEGGPLLMTSPWSLRSDVAAELSRLDPARVVMVGNSSRLSGSVQNAVDKRLP